MDCVRQNGRVNQAVTVCDNARHFAFLQASEDLFRPVRAHRAVSVRITQQRFVPIFLRGLILVHGCRYSETQRVPIAELRRHAATKRQLADGG
jgi:hypothetical protein